MSNVNDCACAACASLAWMDVSTSTPTAHVTTVNGMNRSKDETSMEHSSTHAIQSHSQIPQESLVGTFGRIFELGTEAEKRQALGERLFPLVQQQLSQSKMSYMAGKVTGMLLEIDKKEIVHLIASADALKAKIVEALAVLEAHQAKQMYEADMAARKTLFDTS